MTVFCACMIGPNDPDPACPECRGSGDPAKPFCQLGYHHKALATGNCNLCGATPEDVNAQARADLSSRINTAGAQMAHDMDTLMREHMYGDDPQALTGERKSTHGDWMAQSATGVALDLAAQAGTGYTALAPHQRKAVDMILVKVSRIVSGDPSHADHWDDIAGYAFLGKSGHNGA